MNERCETCQFFKPFDASEGYAYEGRCRRYAPVVFMVGSSKVTEWPTVKENEWCGEYEKR